LFGLAQRRARDNLHRQFFEHFVHRSATLQISRNNQNRYFILRSALLGQWFFENGASICGRRWPPCPGSFSPCKINRQECT
jgi:hypothetical protein